MPAAKKEKEVLSFEASLERLEQISDILENKNPALNDALSLYEEGIKLIKQCSKQLESAQSKITVLSRDEK